MPNCEVYISKMPVDTKPKIHEGRKSSKPLMEKRRRARINESLSQLKSLILEATNKDSSRHSKLEKADILEMTVKHLRNIQRTHLAAPHGGDSNAAGRFHQGYSECIHEVARFFSNIENIGSTEMRVTLINHLANACNPPTPSSPPAPQQPSPPTSPVAASPIGALPQTQPMVSYAGQQVTAPSPAIASAAVNCNAAQVPSQPIRMQISPVVSSPTSATTANVSTAAHIQQQKFVQSRIEATSPSASNITTNATNTIAAPAQVLSGIPVGIPGTLPSGGEITLVLPPQALAGGQLPSHFIPVYAQSAPILTSPTISPASQGPVHVAVSSADSPKAYAQVHLSPSPISPPQHQQLTTVQSPTLVAVPAPAPAPVMQQHTKVSLQSVPQQLPNQPKTVLQAVNVQQPQCKEEPVWRPWNHMK